MSPTEMIAAAAAAGKSQSRSTFNFSAGPGCLPEVVLQRAQRDLWDLLGTGIGILEHSHRGKAYDRVLEEAIADGRKVGTIPESHHILFLQGGATTQCWQVPANFLPADRTADHFETGKWAEDSIAGGKYYGQVHIAASSKASNYNHIPTGSAVKYSDNPVYVHFTSNNTIMGTEFRAEPTPPKGSFLVCDASSNIFSKPIDITKYGLLYAGGQKNLGPAGTVMVIVRDDVLGKICRELHPMVSYKVQAEKESRYNTPPTFGVYLIGQMFKWILEQGGLEKMAQYNAEKAGLIYSVLDELDFYTPHATPESRSMMNITFKTPSEALDKKFIAEAAKHGMDGLAGHRQIGGMRASIYNAFPREGCVAMAQFLREFARVNG